MSAALFVLLLSVAANIFFLVTRNAPWAPKQGIFNPRHVDEPLLMGPVAYGQVQRGFAVKSVATSGTSALLPVHEYLIPDGMVPPLTGALPLYRDQGVPLDESEIQRIFDRLGVTLHWQNLQLLPVLSRWRSADRSMEIALDIEKRALTITRTGSFSPAPEGRATDDATIAIAREFAMSLGIDPAIYGHPAIVERATEAGGALRTYVVWPMIFSGVPLLDADAESVPAVQVQVGRLSRKALSITVTLLQPDRMSKSAYPRSLKDAVDGSLRVGGMLPISTELKGAKTDVVYTSIAPSFVLLLGDREYPTYIVPTLLVEYTQGTVKGKTFVPALSSDQFMWRAPVKQITLPAGSGSMKVPTSATGGVKTGTGS